jgi:HK97 family phage prohead protease
MTDRPVRAFEGGITKAVGDRQVRCVLSTPRLDRHGDIVEVAGIELTEYRRNPVVLWGHDHDEPIARCVEIGIVGQELQATVQFPPLGTSDDADEAYRLIRAGVVSAVSIGFLPKEWSYLDDKAPWNGVRYRSCELIEFSFVSVPANPDAIVIERSALKRRGAGDAILDSVMRTVSVAKAGRVISRANEEKLRAAHAAIGEVLAQLTAAEGKTLYVKRPVLNGAEIRAWAKEAGFPQTLPPEEMHVTLAFSKAKLDWSLLTAATDQVAVSGGARSIMPLGDKGAVVLRIESEALSARWAEFREAGASWDWDGYKPHVTLTYAGGVDPSAMQAFGGDILLGPEVFAEVKQDWETSVKEEPFFRACEGCADPTSCEASGCRAKAAAAARLRAVEARLRLARMAA